MTKTSDRILLSAILCVVSGSSVWGDARFVDPVIPDGEKVVYDLYLDDDKSRLEDRVEIVEKDGKKYYHTDTRSRDYDLRIEIRKSDMVVQYASTTMRDGHVAIERTSRVHKVKKPLGSNEVGLVDYYGLCYVLRGYPFDRLKEVVFRMLGDPNAFPLLVKQSAREKVTVNGKQYDCYRLTMSLTGIWGKFFAKTHMWYTAAKPHYLVKSEGPTGGPGSPKRVVELREYSVEGKGNEQ